ncbi:MAG: CAP domain-containing protein [Thermoanaerobaculia bacterium]|nr:CAP domain-containing protein [Thermoanaerobaculia bacterium]
MHVLSEPAGLIRPSWWLIGILLAVSVWPADAPSDEISRVRVIDEINRHRIDNGLDPLRGDDRLHQAAEDRLDDMFELGYWAHESPEGNSPFVWLKRRTYRYRAAGENLAVGYETASILVRSWMESQGHRANILSPDFEHVGVASMPGGVTGRRSGRSVVVLFASESETISAGHD